MTAQNKWMSLTEVTQADVDYWTGEVSITMSRSEWQYVEIQLLLRGTDNRLKEVTRKANRKYSNRIGNAIK
ncbi:MAG: hypothetical protein VW683_14455 [Betaproteobacteria bacterium]|jgi:hypothetical protein